MRLTNYWFLLIWLGIAGTACSLIFAKKTVTVLGKEETRWAWFPILLLTLPYIVWAANRQWFGDTEAYRAAFFRVPASLSALPGYLATVRKDFGFTIVTFLTKLAVGENDAAFFFVIAAFQMLCVAFFFRTYSKRFLLCLFMFIASTDYLSWMFNGMRQFLAVCITLLCFGLILRKRYVLSLLFICLAATIHGSALLMIPILLVARGEAFNQRTMLAMLAIVLAVLFVGRFTTLLGNVLADTQYSDMLTNGIWEDDNGTNLFRVAFYSIPAILALIGRKRIRLENDPVVNLCVNYSIMTALLYILSAATSGIYIGRIPIYTTLPGYAVCPWLIERIFTKQSVPLVYTGLVILYLCFFYFQMHMTWGLI